MSRAREQAHATAALDIEELGDLRAPVDISGVRTHLRGPSGELPSLLQARPLPKQADRLGRIGWPTEQPT